MSAATVSAPATGLGLRLTSRRGVPLADRIFTSSLLIGPPAPRMVVSGMKGGLLPGRRVAEPCPGLQSSQRTLMEAIRLRNQARKFLSFLGIALFCFCGRAQQAAWQPAPGHITLPLWPNG